MQTEENDIPPAVKHLVTIPIEQLKDELPVYDKSAYRILLHAIGAVQSIKPAPDRPKTRLQLLRKRCEEITGGKA